MMASMMISSLVEPNELQWLDFNDWGPRHIPFPRWWANVNGIFLRTSQRQEWALQRHSYFWWISIYERNSKSYHKSSLSSEVVNSILALSNGKEAYGIFKLLAQCANCYYVPRHLQWRHNERDSVSDNLRLVCSTVYFRGRSKKISKLRVTGLYEGNPPVTGGFPSQRASKAENVSIWWRHHELLTWFALCFVGNG